MRTLLDFGCLLFSVFGAGLARYFVHSELMLFQLFFSSNLLFQVSLHQKFQKKVSLHQKNETPRAFRTCILTLGVAATVVFSTRLLDSDLCLYGVPLSSLQLVLVALSSMDAVIQYQKLVIDVPIISKFIF